MKTCIDCHTTKDISEFRPDRQKKGGHKNYCKSCQDVRNARTNKNRMFIKGIGYIPKRDKRYAHIWKAGRYDSILDVATRKELKETTAGDVYIIGNHSFEGWYKVGRALNSKSRLGDYQTSSPFRDYKLLYNLYFEDCKTAEREVHAQLKSHSKLVQYQNEWFMIDPSVIRKVILDVKENHTRHRDQQQSGQDMGLCNRGSSNRRGNSSQDTGDPQFVIIGL